MVFPVVQLKKAVLLVGAKRDISVYMYNLPALKAQDMYHFPYLIHSQLNGGRKHFLSAQAKKKHPTQDCKKRKNPVYFEFDSKSPISKHVNK